MAQKKKTKETQCWQQFYKEREQILIGYPNVSAHWWGAPCVAPKPNIRLIKCVKFCVSLRLEGLDSLSPPSLKLIWFYLFIYLNSKKFQIIWNSFPRRQKKTVFLFPIYEQKITASNRRKMASTENQRLFCTINEVRGGPSKPVQWLKWFLTMRGREKVL